MANLEESNLQSATWPELLFAARYRSVTEGLGWGFVHRQDKCRETRQHSVEQDGSVERAKRRSISNPPPCLGLIPCFTHNREGNCL
jgi:hypothetical protein